MSSEFYALNMADHVDAEMEKIHETSNIIKRKESTARRKRLLEKIARYSQKPAPATPCCNHDKGTFLCNTLTREDIEAFNTRFYKNDDKQRQDAFILMHTEQKIPKKLLKGEKKYRHKVSVKYFVSRRQSPALIVPVCKKFFIHILCVGKGRVDGVIDRYLTTGAIPKETRGGPRENKLFNRKRLAVKAFIESFKVTPKYSRSSKKNKQYLPADLNVNKMRQMYNNQASADMTVSNWFFSNIFKSDYNLAFEKTKKENT